MSHHDTHDTPPQIRAANAARVQMLADAAAMDPKKVAKAARVVRSALRQGTLTVADLVDDAEQIPA